MKKYEEDEIQVLGTSENKFASTGKRFPILIIGCVAIMVAILVFLYVGHKPADSDAQQPLLDEPRPRVKDLPANRIPSVMASADSINDVAVMIYSLNHLRAELSFQLPDKQDTTVYFAIQAADIRKDNKEIVGDFVLKGEQLARGKRKTGYCSIIGGTISLGNTINEDVKEACMQAKGDFFRQYTLVIEGEIQENRLKGKAVRRALAKQGNDLYIVESLNRESLYDFSEALADFGFTQALYLVGGSSYGWWRESRLVTHDLGLPNQQSLPNTNYLIFKKAESN